MVLSMTISYSNDFCIKIKQQQNDLELAISFLKDDISNTESKINKKQREHDRTWPTPCLEGWPCIFKQYRSILRKDINELDEKIKELVRLKQKKEEEVTACKNQLLHCPTFREMRISKKEETTTIPPKRWGS